MNAKLETMELLEKRAERLNGLYELYLNDCEHEDMKPSMGDFMVWLAEEYPDIYAEEGFDGA